MVQTTLLPKCPTLSTTQINGVWGHYPEKINSNARLRILYNHLRGLKLGQTILSTTHSFSAIETLGLGVLCIAETNLNWSKIGVYRKLKEVATKIWDNYSIIYSYINEQFSTEI
jgi:hypothetical protein